jgi:general stress protein 26
MFQGMPIFVNKQLYMENRDSDHHHDLQQHEAVDKLRSLIKSAKVCMFQTLTANPPFSLRPMSPVETDDTGNIWFFSGRHSDKNHDITTNPHVQLIFSNMQDSEFLSVYGMASIIDDRKRFEELWTPLVNVWFPGGVDDPELTLIKVTPITAHYWDTKDGKMVSMLKMAASMLSGRTMDGGVEGDLLL